MVEIAELSSRGGRKYNEDSISVLRKEECQCVVVADGLGGHGGGKTASSLAAGQIKQAFEKELAVDEAWIHELYEKVNKAVLDAQTESCKMKTTCVSLFLVQDKALWAHLGDSRLYHFVDGELKEQTVDHSVSQMAVFSGEITKDKIRFHEDRNRVLRALGSDTPVRPDIKEELLDERFHAFLLCTDGFWEYVLEDEMEIDLSKTDDPSMWLAYMEERLKKKVKGKNDNYSAAALFYRRKDNGGNL